MDDLRFALRSLRSSAGIALAAGLTLALGIGGLCAIFGVLDVTLWRPLPVAHEDQLIRIHAATRQPDGGLNRYNIVGPQVQEIAAQARTIAGFAAFSSRDVAVTSGDVPQHVEAASMSPGALETLGIAPIAGRPLTDAEQRTPGAVLIGESLARARFGGVAGAVGLELEIDGEPRRVAGVLPYSLRFPYHAEIWIPVVPSAALAEDYAVFARMKDGIGLPQVRQELEAIASRMPNAIPNYALVADSMRATLIGDQHKVTLLLLGVLGAFLLLACANVATLLLARSAARAKEIAVRAALGATRGRQVRQLLLEAALIAAAGAAAGVCIALVAGPAAIRLAPTPLAEQLGFGELRIDLRLLAFALACGSFATLAAGVAPAVQASRADLREVLNEGGGAGSSVKAHRPLQALVVLQTAFAFTLLTGGALVIEDFRKLTQDATGFEPQHLVAAQISLPQPRYAQAARRIAFVDELQRRAAGLPGVEGAAVVSMNPFDGATWIAPMFAFGQDERAARSVNHRLVSPGLFATMRIPLLRGRDLTATDQGVVIVSERLARRLWPGKDALGKQVRSTRRGAPWLSVVGVAGDVRDSGELRETWYQPYAANAGTAAAETFWLMVHSPAPNLELPLRKLVASIDPQLAAVTVAPMESIRREALTRPRYGALAVALFSGFGLLLAALGTFGVINFSISQRRREMGVRMALGATAPHILGLVLRRALRLALLGECAGVGAALLLHGALQSRLTAVVGGQPLLYGAVAMLLTLAAIAAALLPALRASSVDPAEVMRSN